MMLRFATVGCLVLAGCGADGFIVLQINTRCGGDGAGSCEIPNQVDEAIVESYSSEDLTTPLVSETLPLSGAFPILVSLEIGENTPAMLTERVRLLLEGTEVGEQAVEHAWEDGKTNRVQVNVVIDPPP
ncbi:MAG: hypothetical protein AAFX94_22415 [Myxococcota bacterium]